MSNGSTVTIRAAFSNRDAAERAIEHLVQEHGVARGDIFVRAMSIANSVGTEKSGPDTTAGPAEGSAFEPSLQDSIEVSADVNADIAETVEGAFRSAEASTLTRQ